MKNFKELREVYQETVLDLKLGGYTKDGKFIKFPKVKNLEAKGSHYSNPLSELPQVKVAAQSKIYAQSIDTFDKVIEWGGGGISRKVAVLNMASNITPGGGVTRGAKSQEEDLCRRSNLLHSLYRFHQNTRDLVGCKDKGDSAYPLTSLAVIYSPGITIYKESETYRKMDNLYSTDVLTMSGLKVPGLEDGFIAPRYLRVLKSKIRQLLRVAGTLGIEYLVLGAWGCGAYGCPPVQVAGAFKTVLGDSEFDGRFKEICFAILEDANSERWENGNYKPFANVFGEQK